MSWRDYIPLPPIQAYDRADLSSDLIAAAAVGFLAVPQGLAYATIAGLPPAMGLYATAIPTIIGSLFRSSRHVVTGPTNAVSLLVGAAIAGTSDDPATVAITLAFMVGILQAVAGMLRLGSLVSYISSPVVLGYITGAGILIGIGQLYNLVGTSGDRGKIWVTVGGWLQTLGDTNPVALTVSIVTVLVVIALRIISKRVGRKIPAEIVVMIGGIVITVVAGLEAMGLKVISDIQPVPAGFPPLTIPDWSLMLGLIPSAVAVTVLSLVESSSVARSIAASTGDRLDGNTEFFGQGVSNVAAAFFGGYPISGSLSRSALNEKAGAKTRVAAMMSGTAMIVVLLFLGPVLNHTPVACLAGLLLIVAYDLVNVPRIRATLNTSWRDAIAFVVTVIGTWALSLDQAIYLGVGLSIVLFLQQARLLTISELAVDAEGRLREVRPDVGVDPTRSCSHVKILHIEGQLFFGAAVELQQALDAVVRDREIQVLVVRLKRAKNLDITAANVFAATNALLRAKDRYLVLAGVTPAAMEILERSGVAEQIGSEHIFPTRKRWFEALDAARKHALEIAGQSCKTCPFRDDASGVRPLPRTTDIDRAVS